MIRTFFVEVGIGVFIGGKKGLGVVCQEMEGQYSGCGNCFGVWNLSKKIS